MADGVNSAILRCPHCHSDNVRRHKWSGGWFALPLLLTGIPLLIPSKKYRCFRCSKDFKIGVSIAEAPPNKKPNKWNQARIVAVAILLLLVMIVMFL
ncbi:MAG: hypothetical protein IPM12_06405 [Flavobacteriales bacterium]|nr:hypothetical protein [Flavobacteriales bacterium]